MSAGDAKRASAEAPSSPMARPPSANSMPRLSARQNHVGRTGTQRDADFVGALRDGVRHNAVEADRGEQQSDPAQHAEQTGGHLLAKQGGSDGFGQRHTSEHRSEEHTSE